MALLKSWNFRLFAPVALLSIITGLIAGHATFVRAQPKMVTQEMLLSAPLTFGVDQIQAFLERKAPALAVYTEAVGDESLPAAQLFWIASQGENFGISPRAVLTTFSLENGLTWPQSGGLLAHLQSMAARLAGLEAEGSSRLVTGLPGQPTPDGAKALPADPNTAQYALERYYASGAKTVSGRDATAQTWAQAYQDLFGQEEATPKAVAPQATTRPFMRLPFEQPKDNFMRVESFFDHYTPGNFTEPTIYRTDGKFLPGGAFKTCWSGMTCYSGHNGIDYPMPIGTPLYAAAAGTVVLRYDYEGGLIVDHGNGYRTIYWHMNKILVSLNQVLTDGQLLGTSGNRGQSTGPHLHFGLRLSALSRDVDPYGWWTAAKDPWPYPSRFMWRGGLLVDDRSYASQLFYGSYWNRSEAGYNGESWYTLSGTAFSGTTNWGIWGTYIPTGGDYKVYAYWPKTAQNTNSATYQVWHKGGPTTITLSQRDDGDRWVLLGTFPFEAGQTAVLLSDLTKDNPTKQRVYFDALKWEPVEVHYYFPSTASK